MKPNLRLKFRIIEKFGTQRRFASECKKGDGWISRLIQWRQLPTAEEKERIMIKLKIDPKEIDSYFGLSDAE